MMTKKKKEEQNSLNFEELFFYICTWTRNNKNEKGISKDKMGK
jgi:hypothetical protein